MVTLQAFSAMIFWSLMHAITINGQEIIENPSSLLIPVNKIGVFSCKAKCTDCDGTCRCPNGYWIINDSHTETDGVRLEFEKKGFTFFKPKKNGSELILVLTVNASEAVNNTTVYCDFSPQGNNIVNSTPTMTATLLVISNPTTSPNPSIEKNSTHITLLWSPPFLWPGRRIQYYNISFVNKTDGSIAYYRVNSTFSDQLVIFTRMIYQNEKCTETEIEFTISAVGVSGLLVPVFNSTEWILPSDTYCRKEAVTSPSTTSETMSYKVAFGISLSAATVLLLVLLILFVCVMRLCSHRFNRIACNEKGLNDTKAKAYNNMVHNPIYAGLSGGPVYDSIWPLVDTVGKSHISTRLSTDGFPTAADTTALQERAAGGEYRPSKAGYNESHLW